MLLLCPLVAFPFERASQWPQANDTSKLESVVFVAEFDTLAYLKECEHISDWDERFRCSESKIVTTIMNYFFEHYTPFEDIGTIYLQFTISKEGHPINGKIARGIGPVEDALALDAIKEIPEFVPAYANGKKVEMTYYVPIRVHLK